jgi:hypothetical protein
MIIIEIKLAEVLFNALELYPADNLKRHQTIDKATCYTPPYLGAW